MILCLNRPIRMSMLSILMGCSSATIAASMPSSSMQHNHYQPVSAAKKQYADRMLDSHMSQLHQAAVGSDAYYRQLRLINALPGYKVKHRLYCYQHVKKCRDQFNLNFKKYGAVLAYNNYGLGQFGKSYLGISAHVNRVFGLMDRLRFSTSSPVDDFWSHAHIWSLDYKAILNTSGLAITTSYTEAKVNLTQGVVDPGGATTFRGISNGTNVRVGLSHPIYNSVNTSISGSATLNYIVSDAARTGALAAASTTVKTPAVIVNINGKSWSRFGNSDLNLDITQGTSLPFQSANNGSVVNALRSDLNFTVLNFSFLHKIPFGQGWQASLGFASQVKFNNGRVPSAYQFFYGNGGYVGQAVSGDTGYFSRLGLEYRIQNGMLTRYRVRLHTSVGHAHVKNVSPSVVTYTSANVNDVAAGVSWSFPGVNSFFDVSIAKALKDPRTERDMRLLIAAVIGF